MIVEKLKQYKGSYAEKVTAMMKEKKKQLKVAVPDSFLEDIGLDSESVKKSLERNGTEQVKYDFTNNSCQKRINATVKSISEAKRRLRGICSPTEIEAFFAFSNGLIMNGGYNQTVDMYNAATVAAAIWILDELMLEDKIHEAIDLLPYLDEENLPEDLITIPVLHPMYDMNLIMSMVHLIRHRNTRCSFDVPRYGALYWDKKKPDADTESQENRKAFDAVISLIDKEIIEQAVAKYTEKVWEFYELTFHAYSLKERRERDLINKHHSIEKELAGATFHAMRNSAANVLASKPAFSMADMTADNHKKIQLQKRAVLIEDELDRLKWITFTDLALVNERERKAKELEGIIPEDLQRRIIDYSVDDPFETAFALLYLLDTDSNIPWLYYGSMGVAYTMCDQLPFDTDLESDEHSETVLLDQYNYKLYHHTYSGYRKKDIVDVNGNPVDRELATNLSQLLYENTSVLFPRISAKTNETRFAVALTDETDSDKKLVMLAASLLNTQKLRVSGFSQYRWIKHTIGDLLDEANENETVIEDNVELLKQENERLRTKNRELAGIISSLNSEKKKIEDAAELEKNRNENLTKEIIDLRDLIFLLNSNEASEDIVQDEIKYPVNTDEKIVSFGGHLSWIKEMRKRFPDVVFVEPETIPNIAQVQNADSIWIQTNCISHSSYYRILNTIKGKEIPIRYFLYSSADKCSKQLIESLR